MDDQEITQAIEQDEIDGLRHSADLDADPGTDLVVFGDDAGSAEVEDVEVSTVPPMEAVFVPVNAMLTALMVASFKSKDDKKREYLHGVHLVARPGETRIVGTDGRWALVYSMDRKNDAPQWLQNGVTVSGEMLRERLSLLDKLDGGDVKISYRVEGTRLMLSDHREQTCFQVERRDEPDQETGKSNYPDIQSLFDKLKLGSRTTTDLESVAYNRDYIKGIAAVAASLGKDVAVRVYATAGDGEPALITFPGCPEAAMILMPLQNEAVKSLPAPRVLEGAAAASVAALRAHQTRQRKLLDKAASAKARAKIEAKIAEYDARIAMFLPPPALPAPEPEVEPGSIEEREEVLEAHEPDGAIAAAVDPLAFQERIRAAKERKGTEEAQREVASVRAKLKGSKRDNAIMRFTADVNASFSKANGGMTLSQLADGLPIEAWYDGGLSATDAAERCDDWRVKEEVAAEAAE